jgi:hypothetical protein
VKTLTYHVHALSRISLRFFAFFYGVLVPCAFVFLLSLWLANSSLDGCMAR